MRTKKNNLKKIIKILRAAIFSKCLDCICCQPNEILLCQITSCPLFHFRPKEMKGLYSLIEKLKKNNPDLYIERG